MSNPRTDFIPKRLKCSERGASSTLMQEIAQGYVRVPSLRVQVQPVTSNPDCPEPSTREFRTAHIHDPFDDVPSKQLSEIMPVVYSRLVEEPRRWRQIHKVRRFPRFPSSSKFTGRRARLCNSWSTWSRMGASMSSMTLAPTSLP